ncbi:uncharacterized protein [Porites lutea]|uniref:uncharacterized protein isoform X2 n=1 Tax=Porites lutea TaxID=51062 RepID=UPI003CC5A575
MAENTTYLSNYLRGAWFIALTHIVVGMLLFVMAIMDRLYGRDPGIERFYLGISSGVWMSITGGLGILSRKRRRTSNYSCECQLAGLFKGFAIASAMFGAVVIYMYGDSLCYSKFKLCEREKAFSTVILVLGIVECLIGCTGCYCVTSSGHEASHSSSLPNVPGGHAQIASMPPESVLQETDQPPPYSGHAQCCSQGADLLLVPLDMSVMPSPESVVQETSRPPPYTGDTQNCTQGPDLQLVPLEMTPMPPQEIDPPPPYHQISTTESDMWSLHDGDQPPPYSTCTEQQHRVTAYV